MKDSLSLKNSEINKLIEHGFVKLQSIKKKIRSK